MTLNFNVPDAIFKLKNKYSTLIAQAYKRQHH